MATVVVTGASRGIGAATAIRAAGTGFDVVVGFHRRAEEADRVVSACVEAGARAVAVGGDVCDEARVAALFDAAAGLGPLHGLVNNAGVLARQSRLADMDADRLRRVVAVNVIGALLCAREAIRRLEAAGTPGVIVNVSSAASRLGSPYEFVEYAATKGAIDTLTIGLAAELGRSGIRVNAVRPGLIHTGIHADGGEPGRVDRLAAGVPLGRGGDAAEVAEAIVWLLSDASSYVSGALLDVAGGR